MLKHVKLSGDGMKLKLPLKEECKRSMLQEALQVCL